MAAYLKFQNKNVLKFDFEENQYEIENPAYLPYLLRGKIKETSEIETMPMKEQIKAYVRNQDAMMEFFTNRSIDMSRSHAKEIMNAVGLPQQKDRETAMRIMFLCRGLSASDDYWMTTKESERWQDVNIRINPLHETLAHIALFGDTVISVTDDELRTPELTNQGAYPKAWRRENNTLYLMKGSKGDRAAEQEVCTSNLLDCMNVSHVRYWLETKAGKKISVCETMASDNLTVIPAHDFIRYCEYMGKDIEGEIRKIDSENFDKMLVVDYLISNPDRHGKNWGFYMNAHTGRLVSLHPLFDHNHSFDRETMADPKGGKSLLFPKETKLDKAREALERCDFRFISPVSETCFLEDYHIDLFEDRCKQLGLKPEITRTHSMAY